MITDSLVNFVNAPITVTSVAVSSNVYDILGSGVGTPPANIIGNRTLFGSDVGIGGLKPQVEVLLGTSAWAGGTSLQVAFQAAVDSGTPTYQPGTWVTLIETDAILTAQLTASQKLARFDFPPAFPSGLSPRYLRLLFTPVGTFTTGTIAAAPVTMVRDDQANKYATSNFRVA